MALRAIDNAPTPTSEIDRPRKQPKLSIPPTSIQKNKRSCLPAATMKNNENQAPPPQPNPETTIEFEYIASEDLKPLSDSEAKIQSLVEGLESKDWTVFCDSLNDVRRFENFHSDLLNDVRAEIKALRLSEHLREKVVEEDWAIGSDGDARDKRLLYRE